MNKNQIRMPQQEALGVHPGLQAVVDTSDFIRSFIRHWNFVIQISDPAGSVETAR
jgi:hypothetical protein